MTKLPTPDELRVMFGLHPDAALDSCRTRLRAAFLQHKGNPFRFNFNLTNGEHHNAILAELKSAGWNCEFAYEARDGNFYLITPIR